MNCVRIYVWLYILYPCGFLVMMEWVCVLYTNGVCLPGMVYNVSPYMQFHPGGEDELLKAAGVDGTDLFDQVIQRCHLTHTFLLTLCSSFEFIATMMPRHRV